MSPITLEELLPVAAECGVSITGVAEINCLSQEVERVDSWQRNGFAGEMKYMLREPRFLTDPTRVFPAVRSIISLGFSYPNDGREALPDGFGRVARYAWGVDYHEVIPRILNEFVEKVEKRLGRRIAARVVTDAIPLLERAIARYGGLGFVGKNTMLIASRKGSFLFLGEILWNVEVDCTSTEKMPRGKCGECIRCIEACPTGAFSAPYSLDARKCISYLTIEKPGVHSVSDRKSVGEWIFGCDVCQEVCPFNATLLKIGYTSKRPLFQRQEGALGPFLELKKVLSLRNDREFRAYFVKSPMLRPRRAGMLRNAAMVAANTASLATLDALLLAANEDASPTVRQTALWSAVEVSTKNGGTSRPAVMRALEKGRKDPDRNVSQEATELLSL